MQYILGAPGSGKTALVDCLRRALPGWTVLDWDGLMEPAARLAGRPIRDHQDLWQPYAALMKRVVTLLDTRKLMLLTVCTPDQLTGWPAGSWLVLDCADAERTRRLQLRGEAPETIGEVLEDAATYRQLGLPLLDTTGPSPAELADALAHRLAAD